MKQKDLNLAALENALETLGEVLASRGLRVELLTVGGGSLMLLGFIQRPTKDLDVVALVEHGHFLPAHQLPAPLVEAIRDVGTVLGLTDNWLNSGPASLLDLGLPEGFGTRITKRQFNALVLHIAGRFDQICFKLYASVDSGPKSKHYVDLQALNPSSEELLKAAKWARTHDPSESFRDQLLQALAVLGVEDSEKI